MTKPITEVTEETVPGVNPDNEMYFTPEQTAELKKLEFEYQRASLAASILEQKYKIKQLQEHLTSKMDIEQRTKRTASDY